MQKKKKNDNKKTTTATTTLIHTLCYMEVLTLKVDYGLK